MHCNFKRKSKRTNKNIENRRGKNEKQVGATLCGQMVKYLKALQLRKIDPVAQTEESVPFSNFIKHSLKSNRLKIQYFSSQLLRYQIPEIGAQNSYLANFLL